MDEATDYAETKTTNAVLGACIKNQQAKKIARHEELIQRESIDKAALITADSLNLDATQKHYFVLGFIGASAKWANPRKEGCEDIFKAGKTASATKEAKILLSQCCNETRQILGDADLSLYPTH